MGTGMRSIATVATVFVGLLSFVEVASSDCHLLNRLAGQRIRKPEVGDSVRLWSQFQQKKVEVLESLAEEYLNQMVIGKTWPLPDKGSSASECTPLTQDDWEDFLAIVQSRFTNQILEKIRQLGPLSRAFVESSETSGIRKQIRVFGSIDPNRTEEKMKAGYHRGRETLHFDLAKVPREEHWLIFVHELAHRQDKELTQATKTYARPDLLEVISKVVRSDRGDQPIQMTPALKAQIDEWILAGLDRGFLAEVRAWAATIELYMEGRRTPSAKVPWLELWLESRKDGETTSRFVIRSLHDRFPDPVVPPFNSPTIRDRLKILRKEYLNGTRDVDVETILRRPN